MLFRRGSPGGAILEGESAWSPSRIFRFILTLILHFGASAIILFGYVGIFILFLRRQYWAIFLLYSAVASSWAWWVMCHIEVRYLMPTYWVFACFAGYAIHCLSEKFIVFIRYQLKNFCSVVD